MDVKLFPVNAPLKPDKGHYGGSCNRRACQGPGATWFNHGTQAYYCVVCAVAINRACADVAQICFPEGHEKHPHTQEG